MRLLSALVSTMLATTLSAASPAGADPLDRYRWRNRLVVAVAPRADDPRLAEQRRLLDEAGRGTAERDLRLVTGAGQGGDAEALRRRFAIPPDAFRAILVGKDGGAKLLSDRPLAADALFTEIDRMPMRRDEMARGRP